MQPGWPVRPIPPSDAKAVAALVLGIVCLVGALCWLGLPLGVPAVILGVLSLRDIRRSDGLLGGSGMAIAGIVMGAVGSLIFVCTAGFLIVGLLHASTIATSGPKPTVPPPIAPTAPPPAATPPLVPPGGWGSVHVVIVHPSAGATLRAQLAEEARAAKTAGERLLVETIAPACSACVEIAREIPEPELQAALAGVRVVHVDVDEFGVEAEHMHLDTPNLPWFYLLDTHGGVRDGISADEWDDNDAGEIAPVLDAFLHGRLKARRAPFGSKPGTTL
jgi:hypothetical protein